MTATDSTTEIPFWWRDAPPQELPQKEVQSECDVAIVGAGYTGLTTALILAQSGYAVQIFDREHPGYGASTRNGGITSGNLRANAGDAIKRYGETRAKAIFSEGIAARAYLRELIETHDIHCDYQMTGRFTGAMTHRDLDTMARESATFSRISGVESSVVDQKELSNFVGSNTYVGGVYRNDIGHFHPAKFHAGLLSAAIRAGVIVHAHTPVTGIESAAVSNSQKQVSGVVKISTTRGTVKAAHTVMATNGYGGSFAPWINRRIVPIRSRIVVTEKISRNLVNTLIPGLRAMGENRNLYRYFRPTPDGERILFGSREPALKVSDAQAIAHVRKGMVGVFPELEDVAVSSSWAGNVAFSRSHLPLLFKQQGIYYAMGYCGSGTVWAPWFGRKVAESIMDDGKTMEDGVTDNINSALAARPPAAIPLYRGRPWFLPAAILWHGWQDRRHGRLDRK